MSDKISDMPKGSVSMRELQQNLTAVMGRVERGETIEVTRHRRLVARLAPVKAAVEPAPWPDLHARSQAVFGDRVLPIGGAAVLLDGRGER